MRSVLPILFLFALGACSERSEPEARVLAAGVSATPADSTEPGNGEPLVLDWDDLLPEDEDERLTKIYEDFYADLEQRLSSQPTMLSMAGTIEEGSALDEMPQLGTFNTVDDLDGQLVEIPGFAVPLDMNAKKISAFLIVPYFGACIHTPPPAPNQIVYATADPARDLANLYYPQWFTGVLETNRQDTDLGNAAYTLRLTAVRPYE